MKSFVCFFSKIFKNCKALLILQRLNELIEYWKDRNKDIEDRKLQLKSLLDSQREQHEELQFYVSLV